MVTKLAAPLLLGVFCWGHRPNDGVAAFNAVCSPVSVRRTVLSLSEHDFYNNNMEPTASELGRRDALARFAAVVVAATCWEEGATHAATAAVVEFSESSTSEAAVPPTAEKAERQQFSEETVVTPLSDAEAFLATEESPPKEVEDFAETSVASDKESQSSMFRGGIFDKSRSRQPLDPKILATLVGSVDDRLVPVALLGILAWRVKIGFRLGNREGRENAAPGLKKGGKKLPPPYGLDQGCNYRNGVDMNAAKRAGLVAPPLSRAEEVVVVAKKKPPEPMLPPPSWALPKPTPYGIENKGRNPFIQDVLEYCEGGKVTELCTASIKGYLGDIAATGAVATSGEATAIVGYLNSLGNGDADGDGGGDAPGGASAATEAFVGYLDALSAGSAPPPSSARAVKTYLGTWNGTVAAKASATVVAHQLQRWEPVAAAAPETQGLDTDDFDARLAGVEGRVTDLETKVDQIPDQVFQKVEAWQASQEERLNSDVKRVAQTLAPPLPSPRGVKHGSSKADIL